MRTFGVLLHISSLPSAFGIGDLGPAAHAFARLLGGAGAGVWQFLPLNPTSTFIGNSPYSSFSAFAGNTLFISPEWLVRDGYISHADIDSCSFCVPPEGPQASPTAVDFAAVTKHREHLLTSAFERNCHRLEKDEGFMAFCKNHDHWLHEYARFVTLKNKHHGASWVDWEPGYKQREVATLEKWDEHARMDMLKEKFFQYLFFYQWQELRQTCKEQGVHLLADIPIYVTHDSVDVWTNPRFFTLDNSGNPTVVSGVPPDYFSETGQRWGTPLYRWDVLQQEDFSWWKQRLEHILLFADAARLDHFRGFCGYWEIPASEETAINGSWKKGPGQAFFQSMLQHFGTLPFVAEDLGVITQDVKDIMRTFDLPGMHVLQFAFGGLTPERNSAIPHMHTARSVVYTGTHDNAPTLAWFTAASQGERDALNNYAGYPLHTNNIVTALARLAFSSVADWAVLPMQDLFMLGSEGRMNIPGTANGNWGWRMSPEQACAEIFHLFSDLARIYGRLPLSKEERLAEKAPAPEY